MGNQPVPRKKRLLRVSRMQAPVSTATAGGADGRTRLALVNGKARLALVIGAVAGSCALVVASGTLRWHCLPRSHSPALCRWPR